MGQIDKQMIASAKKNIQNYNKLLNVLRNSKLDDKEVRIKECEYAIEKQKQIIANIKSWEKEDKIF